MKPRTALRRHERFAEPVLNRLLRGDNDVMYVPRSKGFGGDTVGRLGMCAHTPKRNKNNAHGVTPIRNEIGGARRLRLMKVSFEAINTGS